MRTFLRDVAAFVAIQVVIYGALIAGFFRDPADLSVRTVMKHEIEERTPSPRLLIVGGSNANYGIDSRLFKEAFPEYNPVNLALSAQLGRTFKLEEALAVARPGDVILVTMEYEQIFSDFRAGSYGDRFNNPENLLRVVCRRRENFTYLRFGEWQALLDNGISRFCGGAVRVATRRITRARNRGPDEKLVFNEFGDMIGHYGRKPPLDVSTLIKPMPREWRAEHGMDEGIEELNAFDRRCRDRGVTAIYSHPPLPIEMHQLDGDLLDSIARRLDEGLTMPIAGTPQDVTFPASQFYDTRYHLQEQAARERTRRVVERMRPYVPRRTASSRS